jgi:hypothetical protein
VQPQKPTLTIDNWMVLWNPKSKEGPGGIKVTSLNNDDGRYDLSSGCCVLDRSQLSLEGKVMMMFIDFHNIVVRDGIDPQDAHREFLKIDEYQRRVAPDCDDGLAPG